MGKFLSLSCIGFASSKCVKTKVNPWANKYKLHVIFMTEKVTTWKVMIVEANLCDIIQQIFACQSKVSKALNISIPLDNFIRGISKKKCWTNILRYMKFTFDHYILSKKIKFKNVSKIVWIQRHNLNEYPNICTAA